MDRRALVWALVVAAVATGAYFILSRHMVSKLDGTGSTNSPQAGGTTAPAGQYSSEHVGISFTYPDKYEVESHHEGEGHVLVLLPKGYVPPENGEGPPSIAIQEIVNTNNLDIDTWLTTDSRANWHLSSPGGAQKTTIGGQNALSYGYSGLYENDAYIVAANGKVYMFTTGWTSASDPLRQELKDLISTVNFISDHAN